MASSLDTSSSDSDDSNDEDSGNFPAGASSCPGNPGKFTSLLGCDFIHCGFIVSKKICSKG